MNRPSTVAVVSDIHANYHAFAAVLAEVDAAGCDEIWCLGDTVGYGPRPHECCALVAERATVRLAGNHDLAAIGSLELGHFNDDAAAAIRWTQGALDDDARAFLSSLEPSGQRDGVELFHGSPLDPVWDYVLDEQAAWLAFEATEAPLVLVGHSHLQLALSWREGSLAGGLASTESEVALGEGRWLLNPGSVGQPRGSDSRAAWLLLDHEAGRARFMRTSYPVAETQAEIRERGLPESLAVRLGRGV